MKHKGKKKIGLIILCTLLITVILLTSLAILYLLPYSRATMDLSLLSLCEDGGPAVLYAADPQRRGSTGEDQGYHPVAVGVPVGMKKQTVVPYDAIPGQLINAFVAIEDKRFFEHQGVDLLRTAHAAWDYVTSGGDVDFGGSTITQQLVKNLTGQTERTPDRKLAEIFTALDLERAVDKETILEVYLNVINLGGGCFGVGAAAEAYFGKSVSDLSLAECAALAAITNQPTRYNPRTHPEENQYRREIILREMLAQGYITEGEYTEAAAEALTLCQEKKEPIPMTSWYTEMVTADVLRDLQDRLGYSYEKASLLLSHGDLVIETAMDETLQALVTDYYEQAEHFPVGTNGRPQSSLIIIDPKNGDILAVAGAIGKKEAYYLQNYATQTKRPAGSVIKPLSVYAPALKRGLITAGTVFEDIPTEEKNGRPWPKNADGLYRGRVTIRESVAHSLNTVPVALLKKLGLTASFDFLHDTLGMSGLRGADGENDHDLTVASLALGQQSGGVTVKEVTAAYSIFTEGRYQAPVSYHRVLDKNGSVLLENRPTDTAVLSPKEASVMTHLLEAVTHDGTAAGLRLIEDRGIDAAGKTGTTQNNCDRWFVGYTPRLLCGVWMGYDYPLPLDGIEGNPCVEIWDEVMMACEEAYEGAPFKAHFESPDGVIPVKICPLTGEIATPDCYEAMEGIDPPRIGWFEEGTEPRDCCHLHFSGWDIPSAREEETDGAEAEADTEGDGDETKYPPIS